MGGVQAQLWGGRARNEAPIDEASAVAYDAAGRREIAPVRQEELIADEIS